MNARRFPVKIATVAAGALLIAVALGWWWLTFGDIYLARTLSLNEAAICLVRDSALCQLAASLCTTRHPFLVAAYSSAALWSGVAVCLAGSAIPNRRRRP